MKFNKLCVNYNCNNQAEHKHHKFSNTKLHRRIYGSLIDSEFNIDYLCSNCHLNKTVTKYTEKQFREIAIHLGFILPLGTKSYQAKWEKQ